MAEGGLGNGACAERGPGPLLNPRREGGRGRVMSNLLFCRFSEIFPNLRTLQSRLPDTHSARRRLAISTATPFRLNVLCCWGAVFYVRGDGRKGGRDWSPNDWSRPPLVSAWAWSRLIVFFCLGGTSKSGIGTIWKLPCKKKVGG